MILDDVSIQAIVIRTSGLPWHPIRCYFNRKMGNKITQIRFHSICFPLSLVQPLSLILIYGNNCNVFSLSLNQSTERKWLPLKKWVFITSSSGFKHIKFDDITDAVLFFYCHWLKTDTLTVVSCLLSMFLWWLMLPLPRSQLLVQKKIRSQKRETQTEQTIECSSNTCTARQAHIHIKSP